jgi:zinc protease
VSAAKERVPQSFPIPGGGKVFVESARTVPLVHLTISFRSGAFHDPDEKDGTARMMMRLLRRGADGLGAQEIERTIDMLGAEVSVEASASTLTLGGSVIRRNLEPFIALVGRILGKPTFSSDELERLRRESTAELLEARDNDRHLASVAFRRALFGTHPFGRGSSGRITSIQKITLDDVRAAYDKHFRQGNVVFGFAGDIDEVGAKKHAETLSSFLQAGTGPTGTIPEPTQISGRSLVFIDKPERTQTQILIGGLGTHPKDPDHVALAAAVAVFGGTFTSRLMREVRSKRGWSYGASARIAIERARHAFQVWTFPAQEDAAACIELELGLLEAFVAEGITERETSFIKRYLTRSHAFDVDTAQKRLHQGLDVELLDLPADYHSNYLPHVAEVTRSSANAAVKARLTAENLIIAVVGTDSQIRAAVQAKIARLASTKIIKFDEL